MARSRYPNNAGGGRRRAARRPAEAPLHVLKSPTCVRSPSGLDPRNTSPEEQLGACASLRQRHEADIHATSAMAPAPRWPWGAPPTQRPATPSRRAPNLRAISGQRDRLCRSAMVARAATTAPPDARGGASVTSAASTRARPAAPADTRPMQSRRSCRRRGEKPPGEASTESRGRTHLPVNVRAGSPATSRITAQGTGPGQHRRAVDSGETQVPPPREWPPPAGRPRPGSDGAPPSTLKRQLARS